LAVSRLFVIAEATGKEDRPIVKQLKVR
jgi:hypothetical protein